jgi:CDP-diacylglycerol pyrophosphatase
MRLAVLALIAVFVGAAAPLPPPPTHPHGDVLWGLVNQKCLPQALAGQPPTPCAKVVERDHPDQGFALLKDRDGASQYLLLPLIHITGIEDARLLAPGAPNYFARAWRERTAAVAKLGHDMPREDLSVAVNSIYGRSQDLLHLHIDCLAASTVTALAAAAPTIGPHWSTTPLNLAGHPYFARRLAGPDLAASPFRLLADGLPGARGEMGGWTLVLAGARDSTGSPDFILLAGRADPSDGDFASGEELQDHDCALAKATG